MSLDSPTLVILRSTLLLFQGVWPKPISGLENRIELSTSQWCHRTSRTEILLETSSAETRDRCFLDLTLFFTRHRHTRTHFSFFAYTLPSVEGIFQLFSYCPTQPIFGPHRYRSLLEQSVIFTHELTIQSLGNTSPLNLSLTIYQSSITLSASFCQTFQHIAQNGLIFSVTTD